MKKILFVLLLTLTGCSKVITIAHDEAHGVTCWVSSSNDISCLPDAAVLNCSEHDHQSEQATAPASHTEERFRL
ncbi:hypothetical protein ACIQVE_21250 [Pseudomonas sp. NPDC098747]|uniref:hypothetical protein n=1 Tax=Pseudomonas sp. NPDC098747 TaxID=3364487 RepID=UPI00383AD6B5